MQGHRRLKNNRTTGTYYEDAAVAYLTEAGIDVIDRNVRCGKIGEIDIIGIDRGSDYGETLVFFEVKYRKDGTYGGPEAAVDVRKQKTIRKCAQYYTAYNRYYNRIKPYLRFDVIAIENEEIRWYKNAF